MTNRWIARWIASACFLIAGPVLFAKVLPTPQEVVAGDTYITNFKVACIAGGGPANRSIGSIGTVDIRVQVLPNAFPVTVSPQQVSVGSVVTLTAVVPINTPARPYEITITGFASSEAACGSAQEVFTLFVRRPVRLVANHPSQFVVAGAKPKFDIEIRRRTNFQGPVRLSAVGLPSSFTPVFNPALGNSGNSSELTVLVPESGTQSVLAAETQCRPPNGCPFQIVGEASVEVESADARITVTEGSAPSIMVTPENQTIGLGESAVYDIMPMGPVELSRFAVDRTGLASINFDPIGKKLTARADSRTPPRTYKFTVFGNATLPDGSTPEIGSNPVDLVVRPKGISIVAESGLKTIEPGQEKTYEIKVIGVSGYRGVVLLSVTPVLPGGVTATFVGPERNKVELMGTEKEPIPRMLSLQAPLTATPTGPTAVRILSNALPDAPRDMPTILYEVPRPDLQAGTIIPAPGTALSVTGPFDLTVNVLRNGCQSPLVFDYTPKNLFNIAFPVNVSSFTVRVFPQPVTAATPFELTVSVTAVNCGGTSFKLTGMLMPSAPMPVTAMLAPAGQTIQRGQSASYSLTVNRGTVQGPIALAVTGLPAGLTSAIQPNPITGSMAQVTLATSSATPTGTFPFTVSAVMNGTQLATATANLTVVAPANNPAPTISFFTPANGMAGTTVQITGTNFVNVQNVLFNGTGAPYGSISPTQINATVPGLATTGPITVVTTGGTATSATPFIIAASSQMPQITSFTPAGGNAGTSVRLMGVNLGGVIDVSMGTAAFGFTPIPFTPFDTNRVDVIIPNGVPSGFFRVTTLGGTATSATAFNVTTPNLPEVGGFSPSFGPAGTRVQIIGSNLGGATQVTFGGANASFEPPQANSIFATVPPNAVTGQIRVTTPNGTATSFASFAVTNGGPVITDFQPQSGQVGFSVTIAGANLGGTTEVTFNGTRAQIGIITPTFVQAFVPTGATSGPIRLTTPNGMATSSLPFTVVP